MLLSSSDSAVTPNGGRLSDLVRTNRCRLSTRHSNPTARNRSGSPWIDVADKFKGELSDRLEPLPSLDTLQSWSLSALCSLPSPPYLGSTPCQIPILIPPWD